MINFISIIIFTYNNKKFIFEAIINVLNLIRELINLDNSIKVLTLRNIGMATASNKNINLIKTIYVTRIDCDDVMQKNRIEQQLTYINNRKYFAVLN